MLVEIDGKPSSRVRRGLQRKGGKLINLEFGYLGRFPFVRSFQSVKWNAGVIRTGSGQNLSAHGSELLNSPAPVGQSAGICRVMAGKCTCAPWSFSFILTRTRANEMQL